MARRYQTRLQATNTVNITTGGLTSATTVRPRIYDFIVGSAATPADQAAELSLERYTAAGTSTAVTPQALDPGDPATLLAATTGRAHTVEPTYTAAAVMLAVAVNQRATFRWVAAPGSEIVMPATAANGIGFIPRTVTAAYSWVITVLHEE